MAEAAGVICGRTACQSRQKAARPRLTTCDTARLHYPQGGDADYKKAVSLKDRSFLLWIFSKGISLSNSMARIPICRCRATWVL